MCATPAKRFWGRRRLGQLSEGDLILEAAKQTGADAIHPGYGFLSENAGFARACAKAGSFSWAQVPKALRPWG
jgi:acetyl/propionyl-CoA carboxylase alpha subunit